ncbi:hypothetical protein DL764_009377 [Monosporascus ibericus]|uniref:Uncharacterized protein n=1 Tax=Monosporascus ibericus TaxID=155417 RepID=A0A4Q4SY84_9PEZI|nr:hypothetical protein DL764_009377 [Monosporascus ibericus]
MSDAALSDNDIRALEAVIGFAIRKRLWKVEPPPTTDYSTIRDASDAMQLASKFIDQLDGGRSFLLRIRQEIHDLVDKMVATLDSEVQCCRLVPTKEPASTADAPHSLPTWTQPDVTTPPAIAYTLCHHNPDRSQQRAYDRCGCYTHTREAAKASY